MVVNDDERVAHEDEAACSAAIQNIMLGAYARGYASYWRTPGVFHLEAFATVIGADRATRFIGLIHLGTPRTAFPPAPSRSADPFTTWLA